MKHPSLIDRYIPILHNNYFSIDIVDFNAELATSLGHSGKCALMVVAEIPI